METEDYIGYYVYKHSPAHHTMELNLSFAGSHISGRGIDDVAPFLIDGVCNGDDCSWTKTYASHSIDYVGCLESDGRIWGTWSAGWNRGGFMLWQRKRPGPAVEEEVPKEVVNIGKPIAIRFGRD